jgi:hypothetical protein
MIRSTNTGPPEQSRTIDVEPKALEQQAASTVTTAPCLLVVSRLANHHPSQAFNLPFGYLAMTHNKHRIVLPELTTHLLDPDFIARSQPMQEWQLSQTVPIWNA